MSTQPYSTETLDRIRPLVEAMHERFADSIDGVHPVAGLAGHIIHAKPGHNNRITIDNIETATRELYHEGLERVVDIHKRQNGEMRLDENKAELLQIFENELILGEDGQPVPFEEFIKRQDMMYGAVGTGHPTYNRTLTLMKKISERVAYEGGAAGYTSEMVARMHEEANAGFDQEGTNLGFKAPDLHEERRQEWQKLHHLDYAAGVATQVMIEAARKHYPDQWQNGNYAPVRLWTWVGFDTGGRDDVKWPFQMSSRLGLIVQKLPVVTKEILALTELDLSEDHKAQIRSLCQKLETTYNLTKEHFEFFESYDPGQDESYEALAAHQDGILESKKERLIDPKPIIQELDQILEQVDDPDIKAALVYHRSRLYAQGFSLAGAQWRLNSTQVINALTEHMKDKGLIPPTQEADAEVLDGTYRPFVTRMIKESERYDLNLIDVARAAEANQTIMVQMGLTRQFFDDFDPYTPSRHLMEETTRVVEKFGLLYFAKRTGIDHNTVLSGLYEDRTGFDEMPRIIKTCLQTPVWQEYVRNVGAIGIEMGLSDSNRQMSSVAAVAFATSALRKFIDAVHDTGFKDLPALIYMTGGESMGRSGHPDGVLARAQVQMPAFVLDYARRKDILVKTESALQGGNANELLMTREAGVAFVTRFLSHVARRHSSAGDDYLYGEEGRPRAYAIFNEIRNFAEQTLTGDDYVRFLGLFSHLRVKSGSRPRTRQAIQAVRQTSLPSIRAIGHTDITSQIGDVHTPGMGVGKVLDHHGETFKDLIEKSPDFRHIMLGFVFGENGSLSISDAQIAATMLEIYNPVLWQKHARSRGDDGSVFMDVADRVASMGVYADHIDTVNALLSEDQKKKACREHVLGIQPEGLTRDSFNRTTAYGLRLALMMDWMSHAVQIPVISEKHGYTRESMIEGLLLFDKEAFATLERIYGMQAEYEPVSAAQTQKRSTLPEDDARYDNVTKLIIEPMRRDQKAMQNLSLSIQNLTLGYVG